MLNIFGVPREDDADLSVDLLNYTVSGIWDPSDVNSLTPAPGQDPIQYVGELQSGNLFIMVHTREFPGGAVGGILVPEPHSRGLLVLAMIACGFARRGRRRSLDLGYGFER